MSVKQHEAIVQLALLLLKLKIIDIRKFGDLKFASRRRYWENYATTRSIQTGKSAVDPVRSTKQRTDVLED